MDQTASRRKILIGGKHFLTDSDSLYSWGNKYITAWYLLPFPGNCTRKASRSVRSTAEVTKLISPHLFHGQMKFYQFWVTIFQTFAQFFRAFQPDNDDLILKLTIWWSFPSKVTWPFEVEEGEHFLMDDDEITSIHKSLSLMTSVILHYLCDIFSAWSASHIMLMFPRLSPSPAADCWQETHFG